MVLDLSGFSFMGGAGVTVLAGMHRIITAKGGVLLLASPPRAVARMLSLLGTDNVIPVTSTTSDAIEASWLADLGDLRHWIRATPIFPDARIKSSAGAVSSSPFCAIPSVLAYLSVYGVHGGNSAGTGCHLAREWPAPGLANLCRLDSPCLISSHHAMRLAHRLQYSHRRLMASTP